MRLRRETGDPRDVYKALEAVAAIVKASGDTDEAIPLYEELRAQAHDQDPGSEGRMLGQLAQLVAAEGTTHARRISRERHSTWPRGAMTPQPLS